tara:strand:- start:879 stop:2615 length:1737 start_codon:yes stop_codon:yes gene_type:complete
MKIFTLLILLIPLLFVGQGTKKVLLIGVDGCRPDALSIANTPNIDNVISNGFFSPDALNDDFTISGPGWSSILCGVRSNKHLVVDNDFSNNNYNSYPSIIKLIEDYNPDINTASICQWGPINDHIIQNFADYKLNVSSGADACAYTAIHISDNNPDFIFVHFDDVDYAGHTYGFSPYVAEYLSSIEEVDNYVGNILQAVQQRPNYSNEDWLVLITTDHGGINTSHGGNTIEEKDVFLVAGGDNVNQSAIYKDSLFVVNNSYNCIGDSVELKFDGIDDFVQIPNNNLFNFDHNKDFTIECRVKTNFNGDVAIIGNKNWDSGNNKGFVFSFKYPSGPEWKINIGDGVNRIDLETGGDIANNEWHTLGASFDRDGFLKIFENGMLIDSADISSIGDITTNAGVFLGTDVNSNYDYNGSIAEVRIWGKVIPEQIINQWYCSVVSSLHPEYNSLIGYWKLNEGVGNVANDYSNMMNNGIINNSFWDESDSLLVYDYSLTPRLVDIPIAVLNHLCVPIDNNWELEGSSLIQDCFVNNIQNQETIKDKNIIDIKNILGIKSKKTKHTPLIYIYNNGEAEKNIILE